MHSVASRLGKGNTVGMPPLKLGCLPSIAVGTFATALVGYCVARIVEPFAPPGDKLFSVQIAVLAGIDVLAFSLLAYFATWYGTETKRHNPAIKVAGTFVALGMMCGHGYGLPWLFGTGVVNGLVGAVVWGVLLRPIPDSPPPDISN